MTSLRVSSIAVAISLGAALGAANAAQTPTAVSAPAASQSSVDPASVAALKRMSAYLSTLNTMEVTSEGSLDVVTEDGQRVQLDGVTNYKIRRPGFVIDFNSDLKSRRFVYDGKNFTVVAPKLGYYATVPAPGTNREVLELAQTEGITAYDASYLWLARLLNLELVTLDGGLATAAARRPDEPSPAGSP